MFDDERALSDASTLSIVTSVDYNIGEQEPAISILNISGCENFKLEPASVTLDSLSEGVMSGSFETLLNLPDEATDDLCQRNADCGAQQLCLGQLCWTTTQIEVNASFSATQSDAAICEY